MSSKLQAIPKILYKVKNDSDVIESFLTNFTLEISHLFQDVTNKMANIDSYPKKDASIIRKQVLSLLEDFPLLDTSINSSVVTFSSISEPNLIKSIEAIDSFFPALLGNGKINEANRDTILNFFPQITTENSDLYAFIGFVSEALYAILLDALFEYETKEMSVFGGVIQYSIGMVFQSNNKNNFK